MAILLLENIRSVFNVGSIFRLGDATAVEKILLIGYTPQPITKFNQANERLAKTALGAETVVKWVHYPTTKEALKHYTDRTAVVVERTEHSVIYTKKQFSNPLFIFGNEVDGVDKETQELVKSHIHLPMRGTKGSINVATAVAVIAYHYL